MSVRSSSIRCQGVTPRSLRFSGASVQTSRLNQSLIAWLDSLAPWTHAFTVTCNRGSDRSQINQSILIDAARHFVYRVRRKCYGSKGRRQNLLPVTASYGWGAYGDHPHLHFCFACPNGMDFSSFSSILEESAKKTFWLSRQMKVELYRDAGWMRYLVEHGTEHLIVPLINPSSSASA
jgi:hypothetical protein